jgi:Na+/H+-dicarboxylate symporter
MEKLSSTLQAAYSSTVSFLTLLCSVTPFAVMSLIANAIGSQDDLSGAFTNVAYLIAANLVGYVAHFLITDVGFFYLASGLNPFEYLKHMIPAQTTALACASSAATLPVTLRCVKNTGKVPDDIRNFVLPLGATVNMDGSAIYFPCCCIWLAILNGIKPGKYSCWSRCCCVCAVFSLLRCMMNVLGVFLLCHSDICFGKGVRPSSTISRGVCFSLFRKNRPSQSLLFMFITHTHPTHCTPDAGSYILLIILSTIGSAGAAPVPSSGLVLVITAYNTVFGTTGTPNGFEFIVAIDWFLDRCITALNVTGDSVVAGIISARTPWEEEDETNLTKTTKVNDDGSSAEETPDATKRDVGDETFEEHA